MKDDKKLQRLLLRMIAEAGYQADHDDLLLKVGIRRANPKRFHIGNSSFISAVQIRHQFKLMEERGAIKRTVVTPYIRYEITAVGHAWLKPWYQKFGGLIGNQLSTILTAAITSVIVSILTEFLNGCCSIDHIPHTELLGRVIHQGNIYQLRDGFANLYIVHTGIGLNLANSHIVNSPYGPS